jgi:two-component sensor histidine kinase
MSTERSSVHPFLGSRLTFRRLWSPGFTKPKYSPGLEDCTADALRAALMRESLLLREKEILRQEYEVLRAECDHRLLNGLQMVVSLLSMQSRSAGTPEVAMQLSVAASRVATIERVHRRLHLHDGSKSVGLKKFLQELCEDVSGVTDLAETPRLNILVEGGEIVIPSGTAISLGLSPTS